nr:hypothetical protein [Methanobrevibacter gottschalkii]
MQEKIINFKIINKRNEEIYQEGYVEIPQNVEEPEEWFYYNQSGMVQPRMFTHHDGIGISQIGATFEQEQEISEFLQEVQCDYVDWVEDVILNSEEDEIRTFEKGSLIIELNGE